MFLTKVSEKTGNDSIFNIAQATTKYKMAILVYNDP